MKIIVHIFAIYMLALALVPCGDGGGGIAEIASHYFDAEHQGYSDHEQHSNSCGDDICSPFCICSCCSLTLDYTAKIPFQIKSPILFAEKSPSFIPNILYSSFTSDFWQPPQFC